MIIKAPNSLKDISKTLFLAGSIEMGTAENWQDRVTKELEKDWIILNPRRDEWDNSWEQNINNSKFREQVQWELAALEASTVILMYFDPNTKSPISLLELGLYARSPKLAVVCPEGFYRKGNVDIVCDTYQIQTFSSLEVAIENLRLS